MSNNPNETSITQTGLGLYFAVLGDTLREFAQIPLWSARKDLRELLHQRAVDYVDRQRGRLADEDLDCILGFASMLYQSMDDT